MGIFILRENIVILLLFPRFYLFIYISTQPILCLICRYHGKERCLFLDSTSIKTLPAGRAWRLLHETGCVIASPVLPTQKFSSSRRGTHKLQKNKIPDVAFAVACLAMLACSLTQEPSAAVSAASPTPMTSKATASPTPLPSPICHVKTNVINDNFIFVLIPAHDTPWSLFCAKASRSALHHPQTID